VLIRTLALTAMAVTSVLGLHALAAAEPAAPAPLPQLKLAQAAPAPAAATPAPAASHTAILNKYCGACHSGATPRGDVTLRFKDDAEAIASAGNDELWTKVATELTTRHMPPANVANKPTDAERMLLVDFVNKQVLASIKPDPGPFIVRRLNNREYANTLRDLLYLPASYNASADFPADERGESFDNNADTLTLSPILIERYLDAAEKASREAMKPRTDIEAPKAAQVSIAGSTSRLNDPSKDFKVDYANPMEKVKINLQAFAPRVFRRPATEQDIEGLMKFVNMAFTHDGLSDESIDRAMALAIRAAVMSPDFLFRMERNPAADGKGAIFALNDWQIASRLSYFLWSSMPDDALFAEARAGTLKQNLEAQVTRMLKDPKGISLTKDFLGQWLEIRGLESTPNVDKALLASMRAETENYFNYIVTNNRPITDLLYSDYTFVDARLAKLYGIPNVTGDEFRKVAVDTRQRGGIMTHASILTLTSKPLGDGLRTSPVVRGKFILENLFNQKLPPPPPNVPALALDTNTQLKGTVRQIFEQHRNFPSCAGCHARMDPYGFALENYSGTGQWRLTDNGDPVDASGEIDGKSFAGPVEFRKVLASRQDDFRRAFVRKMLSYALGRGIQGYDRPAVEAICAAVKADGDTFTSVILNVVKSYPFQNARGSLVSAAGEKPTEARLIPASTR
jgi:cytochrome c5